MLQTEGTFQGGVEGLKYIPKASHATSMRDGERCTGIYIHILREGGGYTITVDGDISAIGYQVQEADSESGKILEEFSSGNSAGYMRVVCPLLFSLSRRI
jgi:hypothetical protein